MQARCPDRSTALALVAFSASAGAMTTVPYSGKIDAREQTALPAPTAAGNANDPYASATRSLPERGVSRNAASHTLPDRSTQGFLISIRSIPNSDVNAFDRDRYAEARFTIDL